MKRRWFVRLFLVLVAAFFVLPYIVSLPPIGVEAKTLADADGFFLDIDGLSTYVLARGPQDGQPVILLHGWGASTFTWRLNIDVLADAGYHAVAFDRPPYGLSAKTGENIPYSPAQLADFTAKVMDALNIQKAVIIGQSQGGGVAGYFAIKYPQRVEKLVLVSAALRPTDDPVESSSRGSGGLGVPSFVTGVLNFPPVQWWARLAIRVFVNQDFSTRILKGAYYDSGFMTSDVADGYGRQLKVIGWDQALLNQFRGAALGGDSITAEQIAAISIPVMIAWGEQDTWVPIAVGERLHELLPAAVWKTYSEVGHLPQEEAAELFNADLLEFLRETGAS